MRRARCWKGDRLEVPGATDTPPGNTLAASAEVCHSGEFSAATGLSSLVRSDCAMCNRGFRTGKPRELDQESAGTTSWSAMSNETTVEEVGGHAYRA
jgi:hypothetical protein